MPQQTRKWLMKSTQESESSCLNEEAIDQVIWQMHKITMDNSYQTRERVSK